MSKPSETQIISFKCGSKLVVSSCKKPIRGTFSFQNMYCDMFNKYIFDELDLKYQDMRSRGRETEDAENNSTAE